MNTSDDCKHEWKRTNNPFHGSCYCTKCGSHLVVTDNPVDLLERIANTDDETANDT